MKLRCPGPSWVLIAPVCLFLLHAWCHRSYGIFRDKFHSFVCGLRLDWDYVNHPPFAGWVSHDLSHLLHQDLSLEFEALDPHLRRLFPAPIGLSGIASVPLSPISIFAASSALSLQGPQEISAGDPVHKYIEREDFSVNHPMTLAVRQLLAENVPFTTHLYTYEEKGGTAASARELKLAEHLVIKTLIMEDERKQPLIMLMHGDCQVSTKELARHLKVKTISPCKPEVADRHSGYQVGGTSPFGTRRKMPVFYEAGILDLDQVYINGGKRGFLLGMNPHDIVRILEAIPVHVAIKA